MMYGKFIDNWTIQLKKTILPLLILNMLKQEQLYGYLLIVKIKECTGLEITEGTIYPILNRLKEDGWLDCKWIEQKTGIPRKYYTLTMDGEKMLKELNSNWNTIIKDINSQIEI
ncbi:MAG: PadR family transcriptional regulator [Tannerellaceae bacterium]|nr:PadR family transcriptional regulator [Tannerellaceae bacterium]